MTPADDRRQVGRSFHRHAADYDALAVVQKRVVASLERLIATHVPVSPERVLDIGCGTGALLDALHGRYPSARLCGVDLAYNMAHRTAARLGDAAMIVNGDAGRLPFTDGAFDLIVSSSTLQWVQPLERCFRECFRLLAPGGLLCVAFFGGRTLWELQASYREAIAGRFTDDRTGGDRLHSFRELAEVRRLLESVDFSNVAVTSETEVEYHADVPAMLRSVKGIGAATTAGKSGRGGLGWRGVLNDMGNVYRARFQRDGLIPATYEVLYGVARRRGVRT